MNKTLFSIIIPVYQENSLDSLLEHLSKLDYFDKAEVIIVDAVEGSTRYNKILFPNVRYLISKTLGRGAQMNTGAKKAQGDFLFFLHCDSLLEPYALKEINQILQDTTSYTAGCFYLRIFSPKKLYRTIEWWIHWRNRKTRCPYGDQGYFLKKTVFFNLGLFKEIPFMEDVEFMERLKSQKKNIYLSSTPIYTSDRKWKENGILRNTFKNLLLRFFYNTGFSPNSLTQFYWKKSKNNK